MANKYAAAVYYKEEEKGKGGLKRVETDLDHPADEIKRQCCKVLRTSKKQLEEDLDEEVQRSIMASITSDQLGEVTEPDQSSKKI